MEQLMKLVEELQDTLSRETFEKFKSPEELHYLAQNWPWETKEEIRVILWICESDICSKATALMLFWLSQPQDYTAYKFGSKVLYDNGVFEIIQTILSRFDSGQYQDFNIHYDPHHDMPNEDIEIDEKMKLGVQGVETWYDEEYIKEISWYVPSELESEIKNCTDSNYLNMMAHGLNHFRNAASVSELIIQNPYCDKGTAMLLYWRLLQFYFQRGFSPNETEMKIPIVSGQVKCNQKCIREV